MLFYRNPTFFRFASTQINLDDVAAEVPELLADDLARVMVRLAPSLQLVHAFLRVAVAQAVSAVRPAEGSRRGLAE